MYIYGFKIYKYHDFYTYIFISDLNSFILHRAKYFLNSPGFIDEPVRWCTLSQAEFDKCETLASELKYYETSLLDTHKSLECIQVSSTFKLKF